MPTRRTVGAALGAGLALTAGLAPFGWWPLALAGAAVLFVATEGSRARGRLALGAVAGVGFLGPGLFWMAEFHLVGWLLAVVIEVTLFTLGVAAVPPGRGRAIAFPAGLVLAEAVRGVWPFGGVPIATLAQTQVGGPLAPAARLGGGLAVAALVGVAGVALVTSARSVTRRGGPWRPAVGAAAFLAVGIAGGIVSPDGRATGTIDVALVQGGGERGTRAVDTADEDTLAAHLAASRDVPPGLDLVLWPEDVVDVEGDVAATTTGRRLAGVARRLDATLVVGVIQGRGDRFENLAVAWTPTGMMADAYQKNRRVPFGEYVPLRSAVEEVVDLSSVPRDAAVGRGPGLLATPAGDLGVAISYEVFFTGRGLAAARAGAEVLLVPTNASSFTTTQMPALELGAARLRALETGRIVLQAGPTGFTAIVEPDGTVRRHTDLGARTVLTGTVERRAGATPYTRLGSVPSISAATLALAAAWLLGTRLGPRPGR